MPCNNFTSFSCKSARTVFKSSAIFVLILVLFSTYRIETRFSFTGHKWNYLTCCRDFSPDKSHSKREYDRILNVLSQTFASEPIVPFTATNGDIYLLGSTCTAPEGVIQQGAQ